MESAKLTGTVPQAAIPAPAVRRTAPTAEPQGVREQRDALGRRWLCRNGFEQVLPRVPAEAWSDPASRGWELVKRNARRAVWRAKVGDQTYFLKYYFRSGPLDGLRNLLRSASRAEWRGGLYALRAGIVAVRPAAHVERLTCEGRACSLLVTEAVEPAYPLHEFWRLIQSDTDAARQREDKAHLFDVLGALIARAHQAGFEHLDMHAANILVQPQAPRRYRAVLVDLHSARLGMPVTDQAVVRNLAQLNQWFRRHASVGDRLRFLRAYFRWRDEFETVFPLGRRLSLDFDQLVRALVERADVHARQLWSQRDRRLARNGRYFTRVRLPGGWRGMAFLCSKHPRPESTASTATVTAEWWRAQLRERERWFDPQRAAACKDSHSAMVSRAVLSLPDGSKLPVLIKRPKARNWRRALRNLLPPSRSLRAWHLGNALLHRDLPTARPLACLEQRLGPLVLDSFLVTEFLPGSQDLEAYLRRMSGELGPRAWAMLKRRLTMSLVRQMRRLEERGFAHRDCKAQNILVGPGPEPTLTWIDLDGVRPAAEVSAAQRLWPLMRMHVSLLGVPGLTRTDRARFLKAYFARFGWRSDAWRGAWREIEGMSRAKVTALEARRAWKVARYGRP